MLSKSALIHWIESPSIPPFTKGDGKGSTAGQVQTIGSGEVKPPLERGETGGCVLSFFQHAYNFSFSESVRAIHESPLRSVTLFIMPLFL
jgi:hypothetical protein